MYILFTKNQGNKALETGVTFPSSHSKEMEELEFKLDLLMLGSVRESVVQWPRAWFFESDCKSELQNTYLSSDPATPFPREMKSHVETNTTARIFLSAYFIIIAPTGPNAHK